MTNLVVVRSEYYVYDLGSFVADVGGYLGLCLGMSALTFYDLSVAAGQRLARRWSKAKSSCEA